MKGSLINLQEEKLMIQYVEITSKLYLMVMETMIKAQMFDDYFDKLLSVYYKIILSFKNSASLVDHFRGFGICLPWV